MSCRNTSKKISWDVIFILCAAAFFAAGLLCISDYGANIDTRKNLHEGQLHLQFLFTGQAEMREVATQMHGALPFMLSASCMNFFSDRLHLLAPVAAANIWLPFLSALFMIAFYRFLKRQVGGFNAFAATAALMTFPYFFGYAFSNMKDTPLMIFFSLSLMSAYDFLIGKKLRSLYSFFILLGLAVCIKLFSLLVPVILILWWIVMLAAHNLPVNTEQRLATPIIFHIAAGLILTIIIVGLFFAPALWSLSLSDFTHKWFVRSTELLGLPDSGWNIFSFRQLFYRTPAVLLLFSTLGIVKSFATKKKNPFYSFLLFWFFVPFLSTCLPGILTYDGLRHYLMAFPPYAVFSAIGIESLAELISRSLRKVKAPSLSAVSLAIMISFNIAGIMTTHPYETTFFNAFAGGLKGAQEKRIPYAYDYWLTSQREAGEWLNQNAAKGALVAAANITLTPLQFSLSRKDLRMTRVIETEGLKNIPSNTYVVLVPFYDEIRKFKGHDVVPLLDFLERNGRFKKVQEVKRQGGKIFSIYYAS